MEGKLTELEKKLDSLYTKNRKQGEYKLYTGVYDIDRYIHINMQNIHEFLVRDMTQIYYLFGHYMALASLHFPVFVYDSDNNFMDYLMNTTIGALINDSYIDVYKPDGRPLIDVINMAIEKKYPVIIITNIALSLTKKQSKSEKFDRADFAHEVFGIYRFIFSQRVPWTLIGNISWSREIGKVFGKDSPGGEFRKMMVKNIFKIESVEMRKNRYEICEISYKKSSKGKKISTKFVIDHKRGLIIPAITSKKINSKPLDVVKSSIHMLALRIYPEYFQHKDFINKVLL